MLASGAISIPVYRGGIVWLQALLSSAHQHFATMEPPTIREARRCVDNCVAREPPQPRSAINCIAIVACIGHRNMIYIRPSCS